MSKCNCAAIRDAMGRSSKEYLIGLHEPDCIATNECTECRHYEMFHEEWQGEMYCIYGQYKTEEGLTAYPCNCGQRTG
jgi:hypothetical protein